MERNGENDEARTTRREPGSNRDTGTLSMSAVIESAMICTDLKWQERCHFPLIWYLPTQAGPGPGRAHKFLCINFESSVRETSMSEFFF